MAEAHLFLRAPGEGVGFVEFPVMDVILNGGEAGVRDRTRAEGSR